MRYVNKLRASISPVSLVAGAIIAVLTIASINNGGDETHTADMRIEPQAQNLVVGDPLEINLIIDSPIATNAFAGELSFNHEILRVKSIDYNTSIADLWAEKPWYNNGEGTLNFAGGTTKQGGFIGSGTLIKVQFETIEVGEGMISIKNPRILLHDGLGTDSQLKETVDGIFTISKQDQQIMAVSEERNSRYRVASSVPSTDLNGDGKQSLADISIFMLNITSEDPRFDLNMDGEVNIKDLSILFNS